MRTRLKEWSLRLVLLAGSLLLVFCVLEVMLRVFGYADPATRWDPFQGFEGSSPIYVLEQRTGEHVMVPAANRPGITRSFLEPKPAGLVRIFALGGSTTYGVPWGSEWAFPQWLELDIRQRLGVEAEVINVSTSGHGSARVLEVLREVVRYDPDLIVVYTGQNEFRDAYFHAKELGRPELWKHGLQLLLSSRAGYAAYLSWLRLQERLSGRRITSYAGEQIENTVSGEYSDETFRSFELYAVPELKPREPKSNPAGSTPATQGTGRGSGFTGWVKGLLGKRRWDELKWALGRGADEYDVDSGFRSNLGAMARLSEEAGVPIVFMPLSRNRKGRSLTWQPTVRADWIRDGEDGEWRSYYEVSVQSIREGRCDDALPSLYAVGDTYESETRHRDTNLSLLYAGCLEAASMRDQALAEYATISPQHERLRGIVRDVAAERAFPVLDVDSLFLAYAFPGIPGYDLFVDFVHPQMAGHRLIGCTLAEFVAREGMIERATTETAETPPCHTIADEARDISDLELGTEALTSLGFSAFNQGRFEEARQFGEAALRISEDLPDSEKLQTHLLLGQANRRLGDTDEAYRQWLAIRDMWSGISAQ